MPATIRTDDEIADLLDIETGVVFQATEVDDDWDHVAAELRAAFDATKPAAIAGRQARWVAVTARVAEKLPSQRMVGFGASP